MVLIRNVGGSLFFGQKGSTYKSPTVVEYEGLFYLYFIEQKGNDYLLRVAQSGDGKNFVLVEKPVEIEDKRIFSMDICIHDDLFFMVYQDSTDKNTPRTMISLDGFKWLKVADIFFTNEVTWARTGKRDISFHRKGNKWFMYFVALEGRKQHIGVAHADQWMGPYTIQPQPLMENTRYRSPNTVDGSTLYLHNRRGVSKTVRLSKKGDVVTHAYPLLGLNKVVSVAATTMGGPRPTYMLLALAEVRGRRCLSWHRLQYDPGRFPEQYSMIPGQPGDFTYAFLRHFIVERHPVTNAPVLWSWDAVVVIANKNNACRGMWQFRYDPLPTLLDPHDDPTGTYGLRVNGEVRLEEGILGAADDD